MKTSVLLLPAALLLLAVQVTAQQDPPNSTNNFFRVVSTATHPVTGRNYPWPPVQPPGYAVSTGVAKGTRSFIYAPKLRTQNAHQPGYEHLITGFTQAIHIGPAHTNVPIINHYQFATGVAPARAAVSQPAPVMEHDPVKPDILFVADQGITIPGTVSQIYEYSFKLTTPVPIPTGTDYLLFVEFRGGEYQDDPNGGQTHAVDWQGGHWGAANAAAFQGHTTGAQGSRVISWSGDRQFRTKIGLLVKDPVLSATGDHANRHYTPRLANELYTGLSACTANYSSNANSTLFFDIQGGSGYGIGGSAVVFMNAAFTNFPGSLALPGLGNLFLNPADPYFAFLAGNVFPLGPNGEYNGEQTPLPVGALGAATVGVYLKFQAVLFLSGLANAKLSSASVIQIY